MYVQPFSWFAGDIDREYTVRAWCHTKDHGKKVLLIIKGEYPSVIVDADRDTPGAIKSIVSESKSLYRGRPVKIKEAFYQNGYARWKDKDFHTDSYGSGISDVTKYLTKMGLEYCQWLKITLPDNQPQPDELTVDHDEYTITSDCIQGLDVVWPSHPSVVAYDIETWSSQKGKFPDENFAEDVVFMISVVYDVLDGTSGTSGGSNRKKFLLTLRECEVPDTTVILFNDEISLLREFCGLVVGLNPTLVTGYNVMGFDFRYMAARFEIHGLEFPTMSTLRERSRRERMMRMVWSSSAYKQIDMSYPGNCEGRLFLDMFDIVKREFPNLESHRLDTVAMRFLGRGKDDLGASDIFDGYVNPESTSKVAKYCVLDSELCIDLMITLNTWTQLVENSNIMSISPMEQITRGQQIRVLNLIYKYATRRGYVIRKDVVIGDENYQGAHVVQPKVGLHEDVLIYDFASLYPSIIIAYNICHTTIRGEDTGKPYFDRARQGVVPEICEHMLKSRAQVRKSMKKLPRDSHTFTVLNARQNSLKVSANSIYGAFGAGESGKVPLKAAAEAVTSRGRELILQSMGKAERLGATVVYGDTDSIMISFARDRLIEIASEGIETCQVPGFTSVEEAEVMFDQDFSSRGKMLEKIGEIVEEELCRGLESPLRLELEGVCRIMFNLCKKKYVKVMYGPDGVMSRADGKPVLQMKGLPCVRRDNSKWVRDQYYNTVEMIVTGKDEADVREYIENSTQALLDGQVGMEDLVITAQFGKTYGPDSNYYLKRFGDRMNRLGHRISHSERFGYLILDNGGDKKGDKMILADLYDSERDKIDYEYYASNVAGKNIDRLIYTAFRAVQDNDCACGAKAVMINSPCGCVSMCRPCWEKATSPAKCDFCYSRILLRHCKEDDGTHVGFELRASKYKFMTAIIKRLQAERKALAKLEARQTKARQTKLKAKQVNIKQVKPKARQSKARRTKPEAKQTKPKAKQTKLFVESKEDVVGRSYA